MDRNISLFSESAWDALEALLRRRLLISSKLSEEDLRYCIVEALESCGMFPKGAIQLNFEHPAFQGKRIDVFLPSYSGQDAIACELKYDRALPSGHNQPRSMKAGALVNDILRLAHFKPTGPVERFLIYLTDQEMFAYIRSTENGFASLFSAHETPILVVTPGFLNSRAASVRKMVKVPPIECSVLTVLTRDVGQDHHLSIFVVQPRY